MMKLGFATVESISPALRPTFNALFITKMDNSTATISKQELTNVRPYEDIPGPRPLPFVANTWKFLPYIGPYNRLSPRELGEELQSKYGNVVKIQHTGSRKDMLFLFDPRDFETVFRNEGQWPIRNILQSFAYYRKVERKDFYKGMGGTAMSQGKEWQDFRTKVNQPMMQPRNTKIYVGPIDEVAKDLVDRMRDVRNEKGELPPTFFEYLTRWSLESIALIALDTRLGCLNKNFDPNSEAERMIKGNTVLFDAMYELELKPSLVHFTKRKPWKRLVESLDYANEVSYKHISRAMTRIKEKARGDNQDFSVLETLLLKNEDPMVAVVMALDMLLAGIDTTSNTVAGVLHYLARNQDKQDKLFLELQTILPSKDTTVTAQNLEDMKYLKACIKEAMRMAPVAGLNMRETVKDIVIGNYFVPKGVDVLMNLQNVGDKDEHFPEAKMFKPERWLKGGEDQQKTHPFAFLPFGFGPRMCIGRRFAELEVETVVAKILRNFRIEYDQELKIKEGAVNMVVNPLSFKTEDRL